MPCDCSRSRRVGVVLRFVRTIVVVVTIAGCSETEITDMPTPMRGAAVARPAIEGPVTGGSGVAFVASTMFDLGEVGYRADEYFIAGTAAAVAAGF